MELVRRHKHQAVSPRLSSLQQAVHELPGHAERNNAKESGDKLVEDVIRGDVLPLLVSKLPMLLRGHLVKGIFRVRDS
jgi:hypothetical protein